MCSLLAAGVDRTAFGKIGVHRPHFDISATLNRMPPRLRSHPLAGFIEPCLPRPFDRPPIGGDWLHEIKHDGFRIMARRDGAGVRLLTRNGYDFAGRFPLAAAAVAALSARSCSWLPLACNKTKVIFALCT